jgi:DNA polymerase (family 10)
MAWANEDLKAHFEEIAELMEISEEDRYRVRAYQRAAEAIGAAHADLSTLPRGELTSVKGIGDSMAAKIAQYLDEGRIDLLEELRTKVPAGVRELTRVPGLGPKTAMMIHHELGVDSVESLQRAIDGQQLRHLPGLGAKMEEKLRGTIERMGAKSDDRTPAADAVPIAEELCAGLAELPQAHRVAYAGSLRRMSETVGDIDVLVAAADPAPVHAALRTSDLVRQVLAAGQRKTSVITARGLQADLRVVDPDAWGAAMVYFTGSQAHNIRIRERAVRRGLTLNEYGLFERPAEGRADAEPGPERADAEPGPERADAEPAEGKADAEPGDDRSDEEADAGAATGAMVASRDEADVYAALDLAWIAPTLREDTGEVEAAADGALPRVVTEADLCGDLHAHSDWSGDGKEPLDSLTTAVASRGWQYWAVSDHAIGLPMNGLDAAGFARRRQALAALGDAAGVIVLDSVELNIAQDGKLDFDDGILAEFDWCVAAVHTLLDRDEAAQTERVLQAIMSPHVNAIGHLTGRKIGKRPGFDIDLEAVLQACEETGTALEINGSPRRLDLREEDIRRALDAGVMLTIDTDAHTLGDLDNARWGALHAQRAWVTPDRVLNCQPVETVRAFVADKRERQG